MFRLPYLLGLQVAPTSTALLHAIGQPDRLLHAMDVWLPYTNCGIATYPNRAIGMAGLAPARLRPCRPLHQIPVVTQSLAISLSGLLPSDQSTSSAFTSSCLEAYLVRPQLYIFRDSIHSLHPRSAWLRTPVSGLALRLHY